MQSPDLAVDNPQIPMPGMPDPPAVTRIHGSAGIAPGQVVEYQGRIIGGPRFGLRGKVVSARVRQAVVDMGPAGTWHIPYHFLALPKAA